MTLESFGPLAVRDSRSGQSRTTDLGFCLMGTVLLGVSLYPYSLFGLPRRFPCLLPLHPLSHFSSAAAG
jgi:hypothetical protein